MYLAVVAGGLTIFLSLAPLVGYLPYSDRPGAGWFGRFPAVGWTDFWRNSWQMLGYGVFIATLLAIGGVVCVLCIRATERMGAPDWILRSVGGLLSAVITGYFILGAGWYISLGQPGLIVAVLLGAIAGALVLPRRRHTSRPRT
ncbi:MAG: hypothetical protein ABI120_07440 [Gemmatimonadaceae bacterium]